LFLPNPYGLTFSDGADGDSFVGQKENEKTKFKKHYKDTDNSLFGLLKKQEPTITIRK